MVSDDTIALLETAPLIGALDRDALHLIAASADTRRLRINDILFRAGDRSDGGYVVLEGELAVARDAPNALVLAGPGSLIGRLALFLRTKRTASAVARAPSRVLRISPTLMRRVTTDFPGAAALMRDALAADLDELTVGLDGVRGKLLAIAPR